jgi:hypothetical protein
MMRYNLLSKKVPASAIMERLRKLEKYHKLNTKLLSKLPSNWLR